jgi:hypothetical protein
MKPALLASIFCLCGSCGVGGGGEVLSTPAASAESPPASQAPVPNVQPAPAAASPARMVFQQTTYDFGEVWDTEELKGAFPFLNQGGQALAITEIKPSCGCTTTKLERMHYEPGAGAAIELVWKPKGFGEQSKTISVHSNSEGPGLDVLTIKARIKPFAEFSQSPLVLGELRFGEVHEARVFLSCADPDFEFVSLRSSHPGITARVLGRRADGALELGLVLDESLPWGLLTCSLQVTVRGLVPGGEEPGEHVVSLQLNASIWGDLRAQPAMFGIGQVLPGRTFERRARLTHASGEPFHVLRTEILGPQPPDMTARVEPAADGAGFDLIVSGDAKEYLGLIRGTVILQTDIPGEQERQLPVYGIVRE